MLSWWNTFSWYHTSNSICTQQARPSRATRSIVSRDRPYQCPPYCIVWTNWPWQWENITEKACKWNMMAQSSNSSPEWASSRMFGTDSLQSDLNSRPLGCKGTSFFSHRQTFDLCVQLHLGPFSRRNAKVAPWLAQSNSQTHVSTSLVKMVSKHQYKSQLCSNPPLYLL